MNWLLTTLFVLLCGFALYLSSIGMRHEFADTVSPACPGKTCTCAGTRHANDHLYRYACECCESAGCQPDPEMDLTPKKKAKGRTAP